LIAHRGSNSSRQARLKVDSEKPKESLRALYDKGSEASLSIRSMAFAFALSAFFAVASSSTHEPSYCTSFKKMGLACSASFCLSTLTVIVFCLHPTTIIVSAAPRSALEPRSMLPLALPL
jgi:hypothetical protein